MDPYVPEDVSEDGPLFWIGNYSNCIWTFQFAMDLHVPGDVYENGFSGWFRNYIWYIWTVCLPLEIWNKTIKVRTICINFILVLMKGRSK